MRILSLILNNLADGLMHEIQLSIRVVAKFRSSNCDILVAAGISIVSGIVISITER